MNMKRHLISLSLLLFLTACNKSDDIEQIGSSGTPTVNVHEYVDLGLPSGTLWATCNVGASLPADYGYYFAWGETRPKGDYEWDTYRWCNGLRKTLTKYCTDFNDGTVDNKTELEPSDDAATANWGKEWRMPTDEEMKELLNWEYCTWTLTTKTNSKGERINGYVVKSKFNGNVIFLPVAGYYDSMSLKEVGNIGLYWSSSLSSYSPEYACTSGSTNSTRFRCYGLPVRPVYVKHDYVDLGLPSGTQWATCNVGAASPADYGDYFAWGETSPKTYYDWNTYKWCCGSEYTLIKYCTYSGQGLVDNRMTLEAADDAATANWGNGWRMPTYAELRELQNTEYCTWTWTKRENSQGWSIEGYEVKSKINGNSLFLPAAGYRAHKLIHHAYSLDNRNNSYGGFWGASIGSDYPYDAFYLYFYNSPYNIDMYNRCYRCYGQPVRPVRAESLFYL